MRKSSRTPSSSPSPHRRAPPSRSSSRGAQNPPGASAATGALSSRATLGIPDDGDLFRSRTSRTDVSVYSNQPSSIGGSDGGRPASGRERLPSIRLRRTSSSSTVQTLDQPRIPPRIELPPSSSTAPSTTGESAKPSHARERNRPRSISQPDPVALPPPNVNIARNSQKSSQYALPRLTEEGSRPTMAELNVPIPQSPLDRTASMPDEDMETLRPLPDTTTRLNRRQRLSRLLRPGAARRAEGPAPMAAREDEDTEYHDDLVDFLDIVDPEIQTLSTLTNLQNSLFVPDLGNWVNRRPAYSLSQYLPPPPPLPTPIPTPAPKPRVEESQQECQLDRVPTVRENMTEEEGKEEMPGLHRSNTITSQLSDSHYAALPHGMKLDDWTDQEKRELDDHVRHMLHSRRARFKRTLKGFGQYVRRPLGFFVTLYAVLITLFGMAWVLFLIGWIYVGDHQVYAIHIIDSVLVALFAVMGDGLAPFRVVDTYHTAFIVHHSRKVKKAKKKALKANAAQAPKAVTFQENAGPPKSADGVENVEAIPLDAMLTPSRLVRSESDTDSVERIMSSTGNADHALPQQKAHIDVEPNLDLELAEEKRALEEEVEEETWLTPKQLKSLRHHQKKLSRSHSFYKPHETFTHNAFPLAYLIAIIVLCDLHSCLQISLGATTWGIDYHHRNAAITTTILCVSIATNCTAGLLITIGDKKTRKKEVVELLKRQELTTDAIKHLEVKRAKEASRSHDVGTEENNGGEGLLVADTKGGML